ncbi:MAG: acyl-CoA thioesterase, partial [Flavitalea sp.]
TSLKEYPGEHRIEFYHDIYNESGKHLTIGKVVLYILKASTMEKTSIPEELASKLRPFFEISN